MAAYAAVVSLMNNLDQIQNHPQLSTNFHKNQIASLVEKLELLLDFIERYNNSDGGVSKEVAEILKIQIAFAAHEAEDVIESHVMNQILTGSGSSELDPPFTPLQKIIQDMDSIKEKVLKFEENREITNQEKPTNSISAVKSTSVTSAKSGMVGFDDELLKLQDVLTGQQWSRQIISIVGMGGAGKTTLARHVYESSLIKQQFDIRSWVTISQEYNVTEQLLSIQGKFTDETEDGLGHQLRKHLFGRRYLIVLDDVWSVKVWDKLKFFFPENGNRSRVVLTTRLTELATRSGSSCINVNFLDEHKSWDLFCREVFGKEECPHELMGIGKKIVERCKGLPLSIIVIAGLLQKSHRTVEYWQNIADNINSILNSKENGQCLDVLYLSYSHLPAHLKPCFLYIGTFKEGNEIRASEITELWIAEGFLKPNGGQVLEETADDYLNDLIDRNLVLLSAYGSNGKIKSCNMHELLRDLCQWVANKEKFFSVVKVNSIQRGVDSERPLIFHDNYQVSDLTSLDHSPICSQVDVVKYRLLRVLERSVVPYHIQAELLQNQNSSPWFDLLMPSSISLFWNLQTLIIEDVELLHCSLTLEIWKMRQLRHLKGPRIFLPDPPQSDEDDHSVVLQNLQTFATIVNFRLSEEACKRISNIKKLHLLYGSRLRGYEDGSFDDLQNLGRLHKLESLNIRWREKWRTSNKKVKSRAFSRSLKKLCLRGEIFDWEDLSKMSASLPQLEVLKVEAPLSGGEWSCVEGEFRRLIFLQIQDLSLKYWSLASASYFPVLEKLVLVYLWELNEIPPEIGEIPTLQLIQLLYCCAPLVISAMNMKEEQESYGNVGLQIKVMMLPEEDERLREMVEKKGMSINNIYGLV